MTEKLKRWPTNDDLLAWVIYNLFNETAERNPSPEVIKQEIEKTRRMTPVELHRQLDKEYAEFHEEFLYPLQHRVEG